MSNFVACPLCGLVMQPKLPSAALLVGMYGSEAAALLLIDAARHATTAIGAHVLEAIGCMLAILGLICAVELVQRRGLADKINGWLIIGISVVGVIAGALQ